MVKRRRSGKKLPGELMNDIAKYAGAREASIIRSMGFKGPRGKGNKLPKYNEEKAISYLNKVATGVDANGFDISLGVGRHKGELYGRVMPSYIHQEFKEFNKSNLNKVPYGENPRSIEATVARTKNRQEFWKSAYNNPVVQAAKNYFLPGLPFGRNVCGKY